MSASLPHRNPKRLVWTVAVLVSVALCLVWLTVRHHPPAQLAPAQHPAASTSGTAVVHSALPNPARVSPPATPHSARLGVHKTLSYGHGEGQPGMSHGPGQPLVGPEAFAVRKDGAILVADVVNQRVLVYATNGTPLGSLSVPGIVPGDVMSDAQGRFYVYDQVGRSLHQFTAEGAPQGELNLSPKDIDTRGYFHIVNDCVYFADAAARGVLVASLQDGRLAAPDGSVQRTTDGVHGESGCVYSVSLDKGQSLRVQVQDPAGGRAPRSLEVSLPGIVAARYAGEDQARQFYLQTERLAGTSIVLEVLVFSASGQPLGTTRLPENDYAIWTSRLVDVAPDGTLVQFLPQQQQAALNLFTQ